MGLGTRKCERCEEFVRRGKVRGKQRYECVKCHRTTTKDIDNISLIDRRKIKEDKNFYKQLFTDILKEHQEFAKKRNEGWDIVWKNRNVDKHKATTDDYKKLLGQNNISYTKRNGLPSNFRKDKCSWIRNRLIFKYGDKLPSTYRFYKIFNYVVPPKKRD